ncbi:MAG TPA: 5'-nucleotidase C-terminal domain-containing protein [Pyrinomonadaceae bacterium]|nr:5'-nucleotidase C-terminal domain-containing protein [Pyrinomonadaceae bacterium]
MHNTTSNHRAVGTYYSVSALRPFCLASLLLLTLVLFPHSGLAQRCTQTQSSATEPAALVGAKVTETLIDGGIPDDPAILKMLEPYSRRVHELDVVIGRLQGALVKGRIGAGSLGNFVTDGLRAEAGRKLKKPIALMVSNSGGLRKSSIAEGELRVRDIFELLPFENALIRVDLTGQQVLKLLAVVLADHDPQSGARITYRVTADNKPEFVDAKLIDDRGREYAINPKAIYRVVTIDYLYNLKSGNYSILGQGAGVSPLGTTMRDALLNYVRSETAQGRAISAKLDNRFTQINPNPNEAAPK